MPEDACEAVVRYLEEDRVFAKTNNLPPAKQLNVEVYCTSAAPL